MKDTVPFSVDVVGEETKKRFEGLFEVKTKLSLRDTLREDEVQRNCLGANPQNAGPLATQIADAIAYLAVRVVKSPDWWRAEGCNGGIDLRDTKVLAAVNNAAVAALKAEYDAEAAKADAAVPELKQQLTPA